MSDAIGLVENFRFNALKAHDRILTKNPLGELTEAQRDLYDNLPKNFKRIDVLPLSIEKKISLRFGDRFLKTMHFFIIQTLTKI